MVGVEGGFHSSSLGIGSSVIERIEMKKKLDAMLKDLKRAKEYHIYESGIEAELMELAHQVDTLMEVMSDLLEIMKDDAQ